MKRSMTIFFLMLIMSSGLLAQTATPPAAGNGTESNPYQIATLENLFWISQSTVRWDKYYVQTADIAAATGNWYSGAGWPMIGYFIDSTNNYPFTGSYIGNGYQITGLRINRPTAIGVGLFGYTSGAILYNIGISSGYIAGNSMVGALVGRADNTTINNCFNYDTFVQGNNTLGGLVGYLNDYSSLGHSYILTSGNIYSYARVTGTQMIGGLVGIVNGHSNVDDSYSNFTVVGSGNFIGGLVGNLWNNSSINYCYTFARVLASGDNVGGLLGSISTSSVTASYWDMEQTGQATSAGGAGAMGRTTEEMTTPYAANTYVGWDFDNTWSVDHMNFYNEGYPHLGEEIPYIEFAGGSGTSIDPWQIETPEQLRNLHYSGNIPYNTYYIQIADINLGISPWNEGEGWLPLSHGLPPARGYYNGNGFRITGLYINRPDDEYIGLFSAIEAGAVSNLTLENVNITGKRQVAALAGEVRRGQIANCHSSGTVTGTSTEGYTNAAGLLAHAGLYFSISYSSSSCEVSGRSVVGGLIADLRYHDTQMSHCFSTGNVSGNDRIGGLIGQTSNATINNSYSTGNVVANGLSAGGLAGEASFRSSIINCYSTGSVTGDTNVGGLLGLIGISSIVLNSYSSGEVIGGGQRIGGLIGYYNNYGHDEDDSETINSYWNIETSGQTVSEGGEGRTTAQMTYPYATNTYVGWDFNEIWNADENYQFQNGYPYLGEVITIGQFAGGTGTAFNPWQIATAQQLNNVRIILGAMSSDKHYVQIANIDLGVSPWNNGDGWLPIGNSTNQFMGTYDGNGYSINGLYIYREDDQGLFGYTEGAQLKNINLNNVSVTGYENAGALVGVSINTLIENCSTTGGVNADNYAGGLVGRNLSGSVISNSHSSCAVEVLDSYGGGLVGLNNNSQINSSFSSGNITGDYQYVGGLAGRAENSSQFYGSFSTGSIYGYEMIGGLAGYVTNSTVSNCYSRGSILGNTNSGGLIGRAILSTISDSYSSGSVFGSDVTIGGLIGYIQSSSVTNSYWNMQTSGQDYSAAGSGRMTAEMTFPYDGNTYVNWDFSEIWSPDLYFSLNDGYPYLSALHSPSFAGGSGTETDPWQIATPMQLFALSFYLNVENNDKYFIQIANIDLGVAPWNVDSGWTPIGSNDFPFTGHYNGNGKTIRNLKIDRPGSNYQGLFGYLSGAVISDLILRNFDVTGSLYVGGLAGKIDANTSIDSCQVMGNVTGSSILGGLAGESVNSTISGISGTIIISGGGELIGGLLGSHNNGSISDSFTLGHVSGSEIVGGLVGSNYQSTIIRSYSSSTVNCTFEVSGGLVGSNSSSTIINSYSNGSVNGSWGSGGLVGSSNNNSILTNCYSIGLVSGTSSVGGLIGASSATTYNNCYWNTQTSGQATSAGGLGRTTAQMTYPYATNTFDGWDFTNIWSEDEAYNFYGYPYLIWQNVLPCPINLTAVAGHGGVLLNWEEPNSSRREERDRLSPAYNLYRNNILLSSYVRYPVFRDVELTNGETYSYFVTALYSEGESAPSNIVIATPVAFPAIQPVGSGTEGDPYLIANLENLTWIAEDGTRWDKHYLQIADIDASVTASWYAGTGWKPIGYATNYSVYPFSGSYDGGNHIIDGLSATKKGANVPGIYEKTIGLFGCTNNASISNLGLTNAFITADEIAGILVGFNIDTPITNCYSHGDVNGNYYIGNLVGVNRGSTVLDSQSSGYVFGPGGAYGGLAGSNRNNGMIINCSSSVEINAYTPNYLGRPNIIGGLVGQSTSALISESFSSGNITVNYLGDIGGLVGQSIESIINESYSTSNVTSISINTGGLIGYTESSVISKCYATGDVIGKYEVGGLIGYSNWTTISSSYSTGNVSNTRNSDRTGGFMGKSISSTILNSYSMSNVEGGSVRAGFIAWDASSTITNCYSTGFVTGDNPLYSNEAGFIATNYETTINNSYWDIETSGQTTSAGGEGRTTAEMTYPYAANTYTGWDFSTLWAPDTYYLLNNGYPVLIWESQNVAPVSIPPVIGDGSLNNPYEIANLENLYWIAESSTRWGYNYRQTADINALITSYWNNGEGWEPIGNQTTRFTGTYKGQGYTIHSLYIDRPASDNIGLFGYTDGALIEDLKLNYAYITGQYRVGGLVGYNYSSEVNRCYVSGNVNGTALYSETGGLIGYNDNSIVSQCFTIGSVSGSRQIGGLIGINDSSTVTDCYSRSSVTGNRGVGGLIGVNEAATVSNCYSTGSVSGLSLYTGGLIAINEGTVLSSYWNIETSGQDNSSGGDGRYTAHMTHPYAAHTFVDWEFVNIWAPDTDYEINDGYPVFLWQTDGEIILFAPANVVVTVNNGLIFLFWDQVEGAHSYLIYAVEDPYAADWGLPIAIVEVPMFSEPVMNTKRFYRITASTEQPILMRSPSNWQRAPQERRRSSTRG